MTREELREEICDMDDLARFCTDHDMYEFLDEYRSEYDISDWVEECYVRDIYDENSWGDVYNILSDINYTIENYDWFYIGNWCVEPVDQVMFEDLREELINDLENDGFFDDEEDDAEDGRDYIVVEPADGQDEVQDFECEDFSIMELVQESKNVIVSLPCRKTQDDTQQDCPIDMLYF